jgi:hypothetical protein
MTNPIITIHDAKTNETTVREMTDEEHAAYLEMQANAPTIPTDRYPDA